MRRRDGEIAGVCVRACARVIGCVRARTAHLSSDGTQPATARTSTRATTTKTMANLTDEQDEHDDEEGDDDDRTDGGDHEEA